MRRATYIAVLLAVFVTATAAGTAEERKKEVGNLFPTLRMTANAIVLPRSLPRREWAPVALRGAARAWTVDESHQPALREASVAIDKGLAVNVDGLAVCGYRQLAGRTVRGARNECRSSIVGAGRASVQIDPPGADPFRAAVPVTFFNGGARDGAIRLFAHAYVAASEPAALVAPIEIVERESGRFGLLATVQVPRVAGGVGSLVAVRFRAMRRFFRNGEARSLLSARCRDRRLFFEVSARFESRRLGDRLLGGTILRPCEPRR